MSQTEPPPASELLERIARSPAFERYSQAFRITTGMSLWLAGADNARSCHSNNPFCLAVNGREPACDPCELAHRSLQAGEGDESLSVDCFAGLRETAVPVWFGKTLVAHLRTGQVFANSPTEEGFARAMAVLRDEPQFHRADLDALRESYFAGTILSEENYGAIVALLVLFASQLSWELECQPDPCVAVVPEPIQRVCERLRQTFDQPWSLGELARVAGMSSHHLCGVFKSVTGITLTEFHNRERILQAKKRLSSRYARVSDVALDVGFGSLSQFNRSFRRYAGESPTQFRRRVLSQPPGRRRGQARRS